MEDKQFYWAPIPHPQVKVPWGYTVDPTNPKVCIPNVEHLNALEKGKMFVKEGHSLRKVAEWLEYTTGVWISHEGLRYRINYDRENSRERSGLTKVISRYRDTILKIKALDEKAGRSTEWFDKLCEKDGLFNIDAIFLGQKRETTEAEDS